MEGLQTQLTALGQLIGDLGTYVVLVVLAFMYLRYTRQREHEQNNVAIVQAETQNAMSANQASLIQITETTRRAFEQQSEKTNALLKAFIDLSAEIKQVMADNQRTTQERSAAALKEAAALDSFSERFAGEIGGMKTAINAAGERMTASRESTDAQLRSIQAGVEYSNTAIDKTKAVIDTLPSDTNKVVLELGERASNDHLRILEAADKISKQVEQLPNYLVKSLQPLIDELKIANKQLMDTEAKLIDVVKTAVPPVREVALVREAQPMNERAEGVA